MSDGWDGMGLYYTAVTPRASLMSDANKGGGAHIGSVISAHRGKRVPNSSLSARNQVGGNGKT